MGSFNTTCAVSRVSITPSDKVRLFFISSNNRNHAPYPHTNTDANVDILFRGLGCYAWDNFRVIGLPVEATYEDYANYEAVDENNIITKYTMDCLRDIYAPLLPLEETDENKYVRSSEHYNLPKEELTFEIACDMVSEGILYVSKTTEGKQFVGIFPVLEEVYQELLSGTVEYYDRDDGYGFRDLTKDQYVKLHVAKLNASIEKKKKAQLEEFEFYKELIGTANTNGDIWTVEAVQRKARNAAEIFDDLRHEDRNEFSKGNAFSWFSIERWYEKTFNKSLTGDDLEFLQNYKFEQVFGICMLNKYNYEFVPTRTSGQEYDSMDHGAMLLKMAMALINKSVRDHDENISQVIPAELILNVSDVEEGWKSHYDPSTQTEGLLQCEKYRNMYGNEDVTLTYEMAVQQGIPLMFDFIETKLLPVRFIG